MMFNAEFLWILPKSSKISILRHWAIGQTACGNHLREGKVGTFGCEGAKPRAATATAGKAGDTGKR